MKIRDQIKLKFQALKPYYDEMVLISKTLPTEELENSFMEGIKAEIRNDLAIASLKIKKEVNDELNAEVMKQITGANPPVSQSTSQLLTPTQEEIEQRLAQQRESQLNE